MSEAAGLKAVLQRLADGQRLSLEDAAAAFRVVMAGDASAGQTGALLMGMRQRGETVDEIAGAVTAMREAMLRVAAPEGAIDTCGTGGDGAHTLNVSTAAAFVVAGTGVKVAKHGNRAITSKSGTADVLSALGFKVDLDPEAAAQMLARTGFTFLMAPRFHPAMRHVAPVRQELGFRTVFNLLGPLANPAGVTRQLIGAPTVGSARVIAEVIQRLGVTRAWVVSGSGGLDELSPGGPSTAFIVESGSISTRTVSPADAKLANHPIDSIRGGDAAENAKALTALLAGAPGPYRDTVLLNAAAALVVAGTVSTLAEGAERAAESIDSGRAREVLAEAIKASQAA